MSYCPECGKEQGHLHLGWNKKVCGTEIQCKKCGTTSIIFRFKKPSKEAEEICKIANDFINPTGIHPCSLGC